MLRRMLLATLLVLTAGACLVTYKANFLSFSGSFIDGIVAERILGTEVGIGWSLRQQADDATKEAIGMALNGKKYKTPDFAIILAKAGSDMQAILAKAKNLFGDKTKIYGGSSNSEALAAIRNKGFIKVKGEDNHKVSTKSQNGLVALTFTSEKIAFGTGFVDFSAFPSPYEAAKQAVLEAMENAGKSRNESPKLVLLSAALGEEKEIIKGVNEIAGRANIILCGDSGFEKCGVAVIYTDLPLGINVIQREYRKVKKPQQIEEMFILRAPSGVL